MHVAFDVGLHNKRLALFPGMRGSPAVAPEAEPAPRAAPAPPDEKTRPPRLATMRWAVLPLAYVLLVASDYAGPPRVHGTKLALAIVAGGPSALLLLQTRGVRLPSQVAVVLGHLLVTASFAADARRFQRDLVALSTLAAFAGVLVAQAAAGQSAGVPPGALGVCVGVCAGAPALLALVQWAGAVDRMTLLTLQQFYVFTTLVLMGLAQRAAPG